MKKIYCLIIKIMPNRLQYLTAMNVLSYATTGEYSSTIVPEVTAMDAIKRFGDDHNIK